MSIVLGIIEFIFSFIAIFFTWILVINIIVGITNPQIILDENGNAMEKNDKARFYLALIIAMSWAIVITI